MSGATNLHWHVGFAVVVLLAKGCAGDDTVMSSAGAATPSQANASPSTHSSRDAATTPTGMEQTASSTPASTMTKTSTNMRAAVEAGVPNTSEPRTVDLGDDAGPEEHVADAAVGGPIGDDEPALANPPSSARVSCESLSRFTLPNTQVTSARKMAGTAAVPEYCDVQLTVNNPPSSDAVRVGVFLPTSTWNGRFVATGGGGMSAGDPTAPCGVVEGIFAYEPCALARGFVTAGTDGGHGATSIDFSLNPDRTFNWQLIEDFGHLSLHQMATTAKAVIAAYYGTGPVYSYFVGGSQGGRQAMMAAQRYPTDYDGVAAAVPVMNFTKMAPAELWPQFVMKWAKNYPTAAKFDAINEGVVAACDELDHVKDGIISDWKHCKIDARDLVGTASPDGRITMSDAEVVNKIWEGPRGLNGEFLWYGLMRGTPFCGSTSILGGLAGSVSLLGQTIPTPFDLGWFPYWVVRDPSYDWQTMTHAQFVDYFQKGVAELSDTIAADNPDLTAFRDAGSKLVLWHASNDELVFPEGSIDYYDRVVQTMGGVEETRSFLRFFMAPGANHMGSWVGPAPADFAGIVPTPGSAFGAVVDWVEHGKAPDELRGVKTDDSTGRVVMTRPICLYPLVARYKGSGSTNDASNFACGDAF